MQAEKLQFLRVRQLHLRVLPQQAMQIGGAPFLGAQAEEIGQSHNGANAQSRSA